MNRHISSRFVTLGQRLYVRGKLATDPVYGAAERAFAIARLPVLDIGCGMGLLGHYLLARGTGHGYLGVDFDERKISAGRSAATALAGKLQLMHADAADLPVFSGHVALLDVLHYLPRERQSHILEIAARHLAPNGRLVIRNVLRANHWRFHATVLEERVLHGVGWMRHGADHYPSVEEIRRPLQAAGLRVDVSPLWGRTPFNSFLLVARHAVHGSEAGVSIDEKRLRA